MQHTKIGILLFVIAGNKYTNTDIDYHQFYCWIIEISDWDKALEDEEYMMQMIKALKGLMKKNDHNI